MDFFKSNGTDDNILNGESITGYESLMWIERYAAAGEFELVAKLSSGLVDKLPVGTIVSHVKTYEACVVENVEITETSKMDPTIKISGRSLVSFLENRIIGFHLPANPLGLYQIYEIPAGKLEVQIKQLIDDHLDLANIVCTKETQTDADELKVTLKRDTVYKHLIDLLKVNDLGIRTVRKNASGSFNALSTTKTLFHIHKGDNKKSKVIFSWDYGELESATYLTSIKAYKNVAIVTGTYFDTIVYEGTSTSNLQYDRRIMYVDAADIDAKMLGTNPPVFPTTTEKAAIIEKLTNRGTKALKKQKKVIMSNVDVSRLTSHKYRTDYDIGDVVSISGNYGVIEPRRVIEFVEIEDANGEVGYPTLSVL